MQLVYLSISPVVSLEDCAVEPVRKKQVNYLDFLMGNSPLNVLLLPFVMCFLYQLNSPL